MATIGAIAGKRDVAIRRIVASSEALSERFGIQFGKFPSHGRDPAFLQMEQLTHVASVLEAIQQALENTIITGSSETAYGELTAVTDTADNDTMLVREQDGAYVQDLPDDAPDYDSMTKAELLELAGASGVKATERMNKADIIALLTEADDNGSDTVNG